MRKLEVNLNEARHIQAISLTVIQIQPKLSLGAIKQKQHTVAAEYRVVYTALQHTVHWVLFVSFIFRYYSPGGSFVNLSI